MCWLVLRFRPRTHHHRLEIMSRRKQANPAKLDTLEEDEPTESQLRLVEDETGASSGSASAGFDDIVHQGSETSQPDQDLDKSAGPYKCTVCGENYLKEKQLRDHEQIHTDHLQFTCAYCPRLFKHKRSRDRHTKLHTGDKKYKCQQCESAFSRSDHLKIHMKTHDSRKPYKCGTCNRGYNTAAALSSHQQSHMKQESRSGSRTSGASTPSPSLFRCNHCSEKFTQPDLLQNHTAMVHSDTDSSLSQTPPPLVDDLKIVCMYCSKDFPTLESMYQHTNVVHRDVPNGLPAVLPKQEVSPNNGGTTTPTYPCDRCTMQLDSLQNLKNHVNNVHWHPVLSPHHPFTDKTYPFQTQPTDLSRKKRSRSDDAADAKKRTRLESAASSPYDAANDKPCICSVCYAQVPNFKSFLHHMETHMVATTNLLGFCPVCGEPGRDPVSFTNHIFSHAIAQVPGRCCHACKKTFDRLEELQKHLLEDHVLSIFRCSICNELFDTKLAVQVHVSSKHSDECKHFKCYLCTNQVFHDRLSAELHISMKHYQQFTPGTSHMMSRVQYQNDMDVRASREYGMVFQCGFCHKSFKDQYSQYVHILKEHNEAKETEKFVLDSPMQPSPHSPNYAFPKIVTPDNVDKTEPGLVCDICNRTDLSTESELIAHKKLHKNKIGPVSLQCAYCNEYCKSRSDLENHLKTHQACGKGKHKCNICDEIFASTLTLADHKLTHCKIVEGNSCVQCKTVMNDEKDFYGHQLQHGTSAKSNAQIALPANCIICCQTLQTDVEIKLHARFHLRHLAAKEYACKACKKVCDTQCDLCNDCINSPQSFDTLQEVQTHGTSTHLDDERNVECKLCRTTHQTPYKLQTHLIEHNFYGMNQYNCYICSSVFTSAVGLQGHIVSHGLDVRPYECSECKLAYFFRAELDNHLFVHYPQFSVKEHMEAESVKSKCVPNNHVHESDVKTEPVKDDEQ